MGLLDQIKGIKNKARNIGGMRRGMVSQGIEKVAQTIDEKTGGEHSAQIHKATNVVEDIAERIQRDT